MNGMSLAFHGDLLRVEIALELENLTIAKNNVKYYLSLV